jgi:phospholipid transport system substrate-binding protein
MPVVPDGGPHVVSIERAPGARQARPTMLKSIVSRWLLALIALGSVAAQAQGVTPPDQLVRQLSTKIIDTVKSDKEIQAGNLNKIMMLVDAEVMPHVNFTRMTRTAVGRPWNTASPEQQKKLQDEFKTLIVRTYSGALTQVKDQTVQLRPYRASDADTEVVVRTEVKGKGDPIQLDYRLEKSDKGWKIYDVNVLGVWLADTSFKSQFAPIVSKDGIDGLINTLVDLNKKAAGAKG